MKGLLRNNFYASRSNTKCFLGIMLCFGVFALIVDNVIPSLLIGYTYISIVGFPVLTVSALRKDSACKWAQYKLTAPVKRADIIKSYYITHLAALFVGMFLSAVVVSMSVLLHGFPFDRNIDVLLLFMSGISVSLFMGAFFYPLFYLNGEERGEVTLLISLGCAIVIFMVLISLVNRLLPSPASTMQIIFSAAGMTMLAVCCFAASFPYACGIFRKKQY